VPTLSAHRSTADTADAPRAHLFVVLLCSNPGAGASRHSIEDVDDVCLGRGSRTLARSSTQTTTGGARRILTLTLPDDRISTSHARLSRDDSGWTFEDLGSKNGSFINGAAARRRPLVDGDVLQVGYTLLIFRDALPTPPAAVANLDVAPQSPGSAFATLLPTLAREFGALASIAPSEVPVLLVSETGTGKEVVARALHALSRRKGAFVPVNCGALPATLAESILFGHKRGAFSGATADSAGLVRSADEGTLLLDEVGDMPLALQPMLLRALQEGEVLPVGATTSTRIRVRFVGATHRNLESAVAAGAFREDLYARLSGFVFRLPPLRERREDIGLLTAALLRKIEGTNGRPQALGAEAGMLLLRYDWPRNVRELEKCLTRAALFAAGGPIEPSHLPPEVRAGNEGAPARRKVLTPRDEANRERLLELLKVHRGNLSAVAEAFNTSRTQIHRWLRRFDIDPTKYRT
jgi:DNA-binding NtrC family response regulator